MSKRNVKVSICLNQSKLYNNLRERYNESVTVLSLNSNLKIEVDSGDQTKSCANSFIKKLNQESKEIPIIKIRLPCFHRITYEEEHEF